MMLNAFIIDGFYDNPDEVRAFALAQDFNVTGNFPACGPTIDCNMSNTL